MRFPILLPQELQRQMLMRLKLRVELREIDTRPGLRNARNYERPKMAPYDHDHWISQAGTARATIGLTHAGPKQLGSRSGATVSEMRICQDGGRKRQDLSAPDAKRIYGVPFGSLREYQKAIR